MVSPARKAIPAKRGEMKYKCECRYRILAR
jgi:hypothetical protein